MSWFKALHEKFSEIPASERRAVFPRAKGRKLGMGYRCKGAKDGYVAWQKKMQGVIPGLEGLNVGGRGVRERYYGAASMRTGSAVRKA